jgi:DNA-binding Lrp family transcriptional regulator
MSVWQVPGERADEIGSLLAARPEVSHCYERECPDGWEYNIFAMIHCGTEDECRAVAEQIARETGIREYNLLFTGQEYKKTSLRLF